MSDLTDFAEMMTPDAMSIGGENIVLLPSGKVVSAWVSDESDEGGAFQGGQGHPDFTTMNVYIPKTGLVEGDVFIRQQIRARNFLWIIDSIDNDEVAWNCNVNLFRP